MADGPGEGRRVGEAERPKGLDFELEGLRAGDRDADGAADSSSLTARPVFLRLLLRLKGLRDGILTSVVEFFDLFGGEKELE